MNVRKMVLISMLLALATAIGLAESFIPMYFIPGLKPGLANIIIIIALYELGAKEALLIDLGRVLLVGALRGSIFSMGFVMSLVGAILSFVIMLLAKKCLKKCTIIGVSLLGSYFHSFGQILVALLYLGTSGVFYYWPFMSLISLATGLLTGIVSLKIVSSGVLKQVISRSGF
jgi:heptaprenyl diphosphate synthase